MRVLYYAHDHGSGHLRHAANVAAIEELEVSVMSGASRPALLQGVDYWRLPSDAVAGYEQPQHHPFHYVPVAGAVRNRFSAIAAVLDAVRPDVVVVDVSAEVAAFVRLSGYAVVVRRQHGERHDRAHRNMYDLADALVAYYPAAFEDPAFDASLASKVSYCGMLQPSVPILEDAERKLSVVLSSTGGSGIDLTDLDRFGEREWLVLGAAIGRAPTVSVKMMGFVEDARSFLAAADLIVTSGGHNAVRDAVAYGDRVVLVPEPRPFDEQVSMVHNVYRVASQPVGSPLSAASLRDHLLVASPTFGDAMTRCLERATQSTRAAAI